MGQSVATFLSLLVLSGVFVMAAWVMTYRLTPQHRRSRALRWLFVWSTKGLLAPLAIWSIMNVGVCWSLQPFMPQVQAAQNNGEDWFSEFLRVAGIGSFIISSYWTSITLVWTLVGVGRGLAEEERASFKALCWTCSIGLFFPAVLVLVLGGWPTLGLAATVILLPVAGYAPTVLHPKRLPPMYAQAVARMKFGKYSEAEWEIIRELEKCEDDFEGWLMLADLYANHFNDLAEAEQAIRGICEQPRVTPSQLSIALHRLADWHLKLACNPDAARRALQMICDRLRGTHLARMAQLRINQLPETAEELREQQNQKPIPLPALGDSLDETPPAPASAEDRQKALEATKGCIERLKHDPNNIIARERLARIFAERLRQADLGLEQLTLLLNMPDQPEAKRAEWLGLAAAWHIKYRQDNATGRSILERVVREFPHSPQALAAQRRIELLNQGGEGER